MEKNIDRFKGVLLEEPLHQVGFVKSVEFAPETKPVDADNGDSPDVNYKNGLNYYKTSGDL